jgi:hypothetical protein
MEAEDALNYILAIPSMPKPSSQQITNLVFVKNFEDKRGEIGRIALREELFIDFLKSLKNTLYCASVANKYYLQLQ